MQLDPSVRHHDARSVGPHLHRVAYCWTTIRLRGHVQAGASPLAERAADVTQRSIDVQSLRAARHLLAEVLRVEGGTPAPTKQERNYRDTRVPSRRDDVQCLHARHFEQLDPLADDARAGRSTVGERDPRSTDAPNETKNAVSVALEAPLDEHKPSTRQHTGVSRQMRTSPTNRPVGIPGMTVSSR